MFRLGRWAIDLAVLFLAIYALAFLPLGRRTGLEHLRAILRSQAAQDAGHDLEAAALRLARKMMGSTAPPRGNPVVPRLRAQPNAATTPALQVGSAFAGARSTSEGRDESTEGKISLVSVEPPMADRCGSR